MRRVENSDTRMWTDLSYLTVSRIGPRISLHQDGANSLFVIQTRLNCSSSDYLVAGLQKQSINTLINASGTVWHCFLVQAKRSPNRQATLTGPWRFIYHNLGLPAEQLKSVQIPHPVNQSPSVPTLTPNPTFTSTTKMDTRFNVTSAQTVERPSEPVDQDGHGNGGYYCVVA